jgi:putative transposase
MNANRPTHRRRSIRLRDFDYAQTGAYFVTICAHERVCLFGELVDNEVQLNDAGKVVKACWLAVSTHFLDVDLDAFVVMPNHLHGIVVITDRVVGAKNVSPLRDNVDTRRRPIQSPSKTIGSIVRGFKIGVTKWFRENEHGGKVWQRNYYEHVIRNGESLSRIRQYIHENPTRWAFDRENPAAVISESDEERLM